VSAAAARPDVPRAGGRAAPTLGAEGRAPAADGGPALGEDAARARAGARRARAVVRLALGAMVLGAAASAPRWGPRALARLAYFRVRRVEVEGARLAPPAELVARMRADTAASVWDDPGPLAARVRAHPLVADARVERRLPGVLVLRVTEKRPVAMAPGAAGVTFYDTAGAALPVGAAAAALLDLPLVAAPDGALLRALGALRAGAPGLFARVSEARAARAPGAGAGELVFALAPAPGAAAAAEPVSIAAGPAAGPARALVVRTGPDVDAARFGELVPVERDLARRGVRPAELDLRFRDQVVARLP
jgi:cell division protein FtsQ